MKFLTFFLNIYELLNFMANRIEKVPLLWYNTLVNSFRTQKVR